jgi:hypothetical protein
MQKVAAVKVDSYDYNYDDVEKGVKEALALLGSIDKSISPAGQAGTGNNGAGGGVSYSMDAYQSVWSIL